jgi:uncharacterized protein DUF1707
MSEPPALRASDADREHAVALLREHAAAGRLTLEEFTERMSAAYGALTNEELAELTRVFRPRSPRPCRAVRPRAYSSRSSRPRSERAGSAYVGVSAA